MLVRVIHSNGVSPCAGAALSACMVMQLTWSDQCRNPSYAVLVLVTIWQLTLYLTLLTGALAEFEASATVLSQAAAALQSRALVYVYSCNMGAAIQVRMSCATFIKQ